MDAFMDAQTPKIAVVIPCYRVGRLVLDVIAKIGNEVGWIFVVDDKCPINTGALVETECSDPRVTVIKHEVNQGVGGATVTGYKAAIHTPAKIVVKIDGDGQMDPALIPRLCRTISRGAVDYMKGNRFHRISDVSGMPAIRLVGNASLSFLTKLSSGYWQLFDPTNGFTAIHREMLLEIELDHLAKRYFFESDLLYNLNQLRAVVGEMPMRAVYNDEPSSLSPLKVLFPFFKGNMRNFWRRLIYTYFVRNFSVASLELLLSIPLMLIGIVYGVTHWVEGIKSGTPTAPGVVMAAALPLIIGSQLLLSWLNYDVSAQPTQPLHPLLERRAGSP
jgi:glycosyltransferase involved in cell wall biosynthesis